LVAWTADARAATIDIPVSVTSTFLLTNSDNTASDSTPIDLTALGILPGATIDLLRLGDFLYCSDCQPVGLDMIGVFSSTPTLLASNELNRVPGAIDMGGFGAVNTVPTYFGSIPTNISQDFLISGNNDGVTVVVPAGAQFLFVAVPDSFFGDNLDENQDYGLRLSYSSPVPEPASMTLTALGLFSLLARRWARSA